MARAILLAIKDNEAAEAFVKALADLQSDDFTQLGGKATVAGMILASHAKLEWVIARPEVWCKCRSGSKNHKKGWKKTLKFGWFVHDVCNRVSYYVVRDFAKNLRGGYNDLLRGILAEHQADIHVMPGNEHIKAGCPEHHDHSAHTLKEVNDEQAQRSDLPSDLPGDSSDSGGGNNAADPTPLAGGEVQGSDGDGAQDSGSGRLAAAPWAVDLRLPD
jgi:hypothetical protein